MFDAKFLGTRWFGAETSPPGSTGVASSEAVSG